MTGLSAHCPATVRWGRFAGHLSMHSYSLTLGRLRLTEAKVNNPNKIPIATVTGAATPEARRTYPGTHPPLTLCS